MDDAAGDSRNLAIRLQVDLAHLPRRIVVVGDNATGRVSNGFQSISGIESITGLLMSRDISKGVVAVTHDG